MNKLLKPFLLTAFLVASSASANNTVSRFIGIGKNYSTSTFNNALTIFVDPNDPQPKCLGCRVVRFIYDNKMVSGPIGGTWASEISVGSDNSRVAMSSIFRNPYSPLTAKMFVRINPASPNYSNGMMVVPVKLWARKCLNPMADCAQMVVKEQYLIKASSLMSLGVWTGDSLPNKR